MYLHGADGLTATLELEVAAVAVAVPWSRAPAVLAAVADRFAGSVGGQAVSVEAGALVGRHTASEGAARIALRLAVLTALRLQGISLAALALVPVIAHPIATAQGAGRDALALGGAHVARDADTGVRSGADSVVAIIGANRLAAAVNVRVPLVALAANLDATHVRSGPVAHKLIPGAAEERGGSGIE